MKGKRKWVLVLGIFAVLLAGVYVGEALGKALLHRGG